MKLRTFYNQNSSKIFKPTKLNGFDLNINGNIKSYYIYG